MAKVIARQLTIDMYNCKSDALTTAAESQADIIKCFTDNGIDVFSTEFFEINQSHKMFLLLFEEGHCTIHLFNVLSYVAIDFFLCEPSATPEKLFSSLRNYFVPEKTKTTYLKRGDFGTVADMKPQTRTRTHHIRNTGAKVIRLLAHRPSLHEKF